jgi:hypothetical protein
MPSTAAAEPRPPAGADSARADAARAGVFRARAARAALAAAALALALVPVWRQRVLAARQDQLTAWLGGAGVAAPREMEHEPDAGRVELRAARAALAAELDPARHADLPPGERASARAESAARLEETARLAGGAFAERPAAWEGAMVMGTATYLSRSFAHDTRLFTDAAAWEEPLEAAIRLAPGRPDAVRVLAGAYLDLWPYLSARKRERERQLLAAVFNDPGSFATLIGPWLAVAPNREEAFAVVPPNPEAWAKLQQVYAQRLDWPGFCAARARWDRALQAYLADRLAAGETRRAGGDGGEARQMFLEVATSARPGWRYLGLLSRALESCPPGSVDRHTAELLAKHLRWSLERCRLERCPLSPVSMRRLTGFCRDLDPRLDAMAALATGDPARAEVLERTYATAWTDDWASYRMLKAKLAAEHGRGGEAEAALAGVPRSWQQRPSYWQLRAALARTAGDAAAEAAAGQELARLAERDWPATAWNFDAGVARLELLAGKEASGLAVTFDVAPPRGAVVEVRLDESILGTLPVAAGATLALATPVAPGLHLLEVASVAGGACLPGIVRLARTDRREGG